jgi:hypothetical protein
MFKISPSTLTTQNDHSAMKRNIYTRPLYYALVPVLSKQACISKALIKNGIPIRGNGIRRG